MPVQQEKQWSPEPLENELMMEAFIMAGLGGGPLVDTLVMHQGIDQVQPLQARDCEA